MKNKPISVHDWIRKAEADRKAAHRALGDSKKYPDQAEIACFHAQQCAEKYLKALLEMAGKRIAKIHDLMTLSGHIKAAGFDMTRLDESLRYLNGYAVEVRYPGSCATPAEARLATQKMEKIVSACASILTQM